jgi:hypothetical protein
MLVHIANLVYKQGQKTQTFIFITLLNIYYNIFRIE